MRKRVYYVMMMGLLTGLVTGCGDGKTEIAQAEQKVTTQFETTEEKETTEEITTTEAVKIKEDAKDKTDEKTQTAEEKKSENNTTEEASQTPVTTEKEKKTTEKKKPKKGKNEKTTEKSTKGKTTREETTTEAVQSNKEIAKGYVGKTLDSLVAAIGSYSSFSKAESCYYEGEYDGIAQFDGFTVYCHSEGQTTWYIDSVE